MDLWLIIVLNALKAFLLERVEDAALLHLLKQTGKKS